MNESTWKTWYDNWNWILTIAKSRSWNYEPIEIKPKINITTIHNIERELGLKYPEDFKNILINYSGGVKFGWQITIEEPPKEFKGIFCGCGGVSEYRSESNLWNVDILSELYSTYNGWLRDCYDDPTDEYGKHYYDKIPFIEVPNGDLIAFNNKGQVIYLSHDDGPLHGDKLADNFIEFITLWSNLGCVGTESEQFSVFYDKNQCKLMSTDIKINRWKKWLEK